MKVDGDVSTPRPIYASDPEYSEEARKAGAQRSCLLWLIVGDDGKPQDIRVERRLGMGLDEKAIDAVRGWIFEPARKDGKPVAVQIPVEVSFRLSEDGRELWSPEQPARFESLEQSKQAQIYRDPEGDNPRACPPSSSLDGERRPRPLATVAELNFEGSLLTTAADQDQIAAAIRRGTYSGDRADVIIPSPGTS